MITERVLGLCKIIGIDPASIPENLEEIEPAQNSFRCKTCKDTGFVRYERQPGDRDFGVPSTCPACRTVEEYRLRVELSKFHNVSTSNRKAETQTFDNFKLFPGTQGAMKAAALFAGNPQAKSLYLFGNPGNGKSHLAAAVWNEVKKRQGVIFLTFPQLVKRLQAGFKDNNYSELFQTIQAVDILIIDDLMAERQSDWVDEQLFLIIDYRYNNLLPTLICSNLGVDKIPNFRVKSRLNDRSQWIVVENKGKDYRGQR